MTKVLLVGAGKIGDAVTHLFSLAPEFDVTVVDADPAALERLARPGVATVVADVSDERVIADLAAGHDMLASAAPWFLTPTLARAARQADAHYFDLTEDVASTRAVTALAAGAGRAFVPQCGLAPGFVSVAAGHLAGTFDELRSVAMRVGALPVYPTNALKYNLTWSTDGLINEYCNPCEAIHDGHLVESMALEEVEAFSLDGVTYEAFNTSGGLGTLCQTLAGRVDRLDYKTVRYPGHRDIVKVLLDDLQLRHRRDLLREVLEAAIPVTLQDVVLVFVTVSGLRDGRLTQESFARKVYATDVAGRRLSAIQLTTAAGLCTMIDLVRTGDLPQHGLVRQEDCGLDEFVANRFGRIWAGEAIDTPLLAAVEDAA